MRSLIDLNCSEQVWQFPRVHAGVVHLARGLQNIAGTNLTGWVARGISVGNGEAEDLPGGLQGALGNVARAALLNGLGHCHQFRGFNRSDGPRAQARQNVGIHAALHIVRMARTLPVLPVLQPEHGQCSRKEFSAAAFSAFRSAIGSVPVASSLRASAWRSLASDRDTSG